MSTIHEQTAEQIKRLLMERFEPSNLEVINESHLHARHKEAKKHPKAGHFKVIICSAAFAGKSLLERHRMIYTCLNILMQDAIHALSIEANS